MFAQLIDCIQRRKDSRSQPPISGFGLDHLIAFVRITGLRERRPELATSGESRQVKDCFGFLQAPERAGKDRPPGRGPGFLLAFLLSLLTGSPGPLYMGPLWAPTDNWDGRVAQRESTVFTRQGSLVQSQPRPPFVSMTYRMVIQFRV